jgi:2,3,4,5-tetrahydropyridine-2,6-dicarboxylate N-succinyltransferase
VLSGGSERDVGREPPSGQAPGEASRKRFRRARRIDLCRSRAPNRVRPGRIVAPPRDHVNVELRDHVAERRDIELVAGDFGAERFACERDLLHEPRTLFRAEIDKLRKAGTPRHKEEPRVIRVAHQPDGRERQIDNRQAVGFKSRVESEFGHARARAPVDCPAPAAHKVPRVFPEHFVTDIAQLRSVVESAFEDRQSIDASTRGEVRAAVDEALDLLDSGTLRVAEKKNGAWAVNEWLKKAVLLSFRLNDLAAVPGGPGGTTWWDKVPSKFAGWGENRFRAAGFRAVPGSIVRRSAYIAPGVVLMPSFVNLGAYVDEGTMVDTWASVGSCAQIGKNVHLSGGAGIGGVLEPMQVGPTIIEDDCFIGARSEVVEGVIVRRGAVLSMGVYIGATTRIVDRATGDVSYGEVPPYSVLVPGSMPSASGGPSLYCAVIVKKVDERTRAKTSINDLLRD